MDAKRYKLVREQLSLDHPEWLVEVVLASDYDTLRQQLDECREAKDIVLTANAQDERTIRSLEQQLEQAQGGYDRGYKQGIEDAHKCEKRHAEIDALQARVTWLEEGRRFMNTVDGLKQVALLMASTGDMARSSLLINEIDELTKWLADEPKGK